MITPCTKSRRHDIAADSNSSSLRLTKSGLESGSTRPTETVMYSVYRISALYIGVSDEDDLDELRKHEANFEREDHLESHSI